MEEDPVSRLLADLVAAGASQGVVASRGAAGGAVASRGVVAGGVAIRTWGGVTDEAVFEAGSITKAVTGLLLALAIQAGEVSSSDRLDRFLPDTGRAGGATLGQLATHTSGLPRLPLAVSLRALPHPVDPYRGVSLAHLIRMTRRVRRGPAGPASYSNLGVALLGHALAAAATTPYWDLARARVLHPLGMNSSGDLPDDALFSPRGAWDLAAFGPAGGLRATAADLLRLAWVAARPGDSPFPVAAADALAVHASMGTGNIGWCWTVGNGQGGSTAWKNGATGRGWGFIGAGPSSAFAVLVPAHHEPAWDVAARRTLYRFGGGGAGTGGGGGPGE